MGKYFPVCIPNNVITFSFPLHFHFSQNVKNMENNKINPTESASIQDSTQLIAPGTPIQFDIVLPATEFLDQNRGGRYGQRQSSVPLTAISESYVLQHVCVW